MGGRGRSSGGGGNAQQYKLFSDEEEARSYLSSATAAWMRTVTDDMKSAVVEYTQDGYDEMNKNAKANRISAEMENLDNAIANYEVPAGGITVVRACTGTLFGIQRGYTPERIMQEYGGKVRHNGSYTSTSALSTPDNDFEGACIMRIKVPAGKGYGAYIAGISGYSEEAEFLLGRNVGFRVVGASKGLRVKGSEKEGRRVGEKVRTEEVIYVDVEAVIM